jgi:quercetin dioxygenase-like cupin family protein
MNAGMITEHVGRGGRPAIVDMTIAEVREIDPGFCDRLQGLGLSEPVLCGPYLNYTVGELARAERFDVETLIAAIKGGSTSEAPSARRHTELVRDWPGPRLAARIAHLDLAAEIERLREEPAWHESDRNAKTLVKNPDLRVVLVVLKAGARLEQHVAAGPITIQALAGRLRVHLPEDAIDLVAGDMAPIAAEIKHDVEALESSAFLLTIAQPQTGRPSAGSAVSAPTEHLVAPAAVATPEAHVTPAPARHLSPDEQATLTEADLRPVFDTKPADNFFAPIEGLKIVTSGETGFLHHGWYVVDEPYAGMTPRTNHDGHPQPREERVGARIPDEVVPGEVPVDVASQSAIQPDNAALHLGETDGGYPDPRHLARGGPQMASH